jgi:hypothetical protein
MREERFTPGGSLEDEDGAISMRRNSLPGNAEGRKCCLAVRLETQELTLSERLGATNQLTDHEGVHFANKTGCSF